MHRIEPLWSLSGTQTLMYSYRPSWIPEMHRIELLWSLSGTQTLMYSLTWIGTAGDGDVISNRLTV